MKQLDDDEIHRIDGGMCGEREFPVPFARAVLTEFCRINNREAQPATKPCEYNGGTCTRRGCVGQCQAMQLAQPAADDKAGGEVVAWLDRKQLAELQQCNGMSVWAESPSIYAPTPSALGVEAPKHLVGAYTSPQPQVITPTGWQPIETAPRDNKRLLYLATFRDGKLVALDFDGGWEYWQESWEMAHINGYYWESANGLEEPTHWAYQDEPLPQLPKEVA